MGLQILYAILIIDKSEQIKILMQAFHDFDLQYIISQAFYKFYLLNITNYFMLIFWYERRSPYNDKYAAYLMRYY